MQNGTPLALQRPVPDSPPRPRTSVLDERLVKAIAEVPRELFIAADKDLPYAVVITAMAAAQQAGVVKVQMLTDSSQELDLAKLDAEVGKAPPPPQ